jgi:hypothetical protein
VSRDNREGKSATTNDASLEPELTAVVLRSLCFLLFQIYLLIVEQLHQSFAGRASRGLRYSCNASSVCLNSGSLLTTASSLFFATA